MRDVFSNASKDQPRAKLSLYEPSLRDSREFRELMQKAVDESSSPDDWLERADEALYSVKEAGGDAARMAT